MTRREHRSERRAREDQAVYDYLSANPKRGHRDIAQHLGVSAFSAKLVLKRLVEARRIMQLHDPTPAGIKVGKFYYLVKENSMHITPEQIMDYDKHCNREQAERLARQINQ